MTDFIANFNLKLGQGVAKTQAALESLKKTADTQTHRAQTILGEHLENLDAKIDKQAASLENVEDDFEDWIFLKSKAIEHRKDERKAKKLLERAVQAEKRSGRAFDKALLAIDEAEREMLRSKIAHADAGILEPDINTKKLVLV